MFRQYFYSDTLCAQKNQPKVIFQCVFMYFLNLRETMTGKRKKDKVNKHTQWLQTTGTSISSPTFYCDIEMQLSQDTSLKINTKSHKHKWIDLFGLIINFSTRTDQTVTFNQFLKKMLSSTFIPLSHFLVMLVKLVIKECCHKLKNWHSDQSTSLIQKQST